MTCRRCRYSPCRCGQGNLYGTKSFPKSGAPKESSREVQQRRRDMERLRNPPPPPGLRHRGGRRRREEPEPEVIRTVDDAYALLAFLERLGCKTTTPRPLTHCPACGAEALCEHGVCLLCKPCPKCEGGSVR